MPLKATGIISTTALPRWGGDEAVEVIYIEVSKQLYFSHAVGDQFPIWYLPDNPAINSPNIEALGNDSQTSLLIGGALFAIWAIWQMFMIRSILRALRARASVLEIVETPITGKPRWKIFFYQIEYKLKIRDQTGATTDVTSHSFMMLDGPFNRLKIGDIIRVAITGEGLYWVKDLQME